MEPIRQALCSLLAHIRAGTMKVGVRVARLFVASTSRDVLPSWVWNGSGLNGIGVKTFSPNSIESECKAYSLVFEPSLNMVYMVSHDMLSWN